MKPLQIVQRPQTPKPDTKLVDHCDIVVAMIEPRVREAIKRTKNVDFSIELSLLFRFDSTDVRLTEATTERNTISLKPTTGKALQKETSVKSKDGYIEDSIAICRAWVMEGLQTISDRNATSLELTMLFKQSQLIARRILLNSQAII